MAFLLDRDIYEVPATPPFVRASRPQNPSMETTIRLSTKSQAYGWDNTDESGSISSMSSGQKATHCHICRQEEKPTRPLIACSSCKRRFHPFCHQPNIHQQGPRWRCFRCGNNISTSASTNTNTNTNSRSSWQNVMLRSSPLSNPSPRSTDSVRPSKAAAPDESVKFSPNNNTCEVYGCNALALRNTEGLRVCKRHEIENRHRSATAQKTGVATKSATLPRHSKLFRKSRMNLSNSEYGSQSLKRKRTSGLQQIARQESLSGNISYASFSSVPTNIPIPDTNYSDRPVSKSPHTKEQPDTPEYEPPPAIVDNSPNPWLSLVENPESQLAEESRTNRESSTIYVEVPARRMHRNEFSPKLRQTSPDIGPAENSTTVERGLQTVSPPESSDHRLARQGSTPAMIVTPAEECADVLSKVDLGTPVEKNETILIPKDRLGHEISNATSTLVVDDGWIDVSVARPDSIEAIRRAKAHRFDESVLDKFLAPPIQTNRTPQPNTFDIINGQRWGHIDPRQAWPADNVDWLAEKQKEIEARPKRKANFGKVLTVQNIRERREHGWQVHQNKELPPRDYKGYGHVEELFAIKGIEELEPSVRNGVLVMAEKVIDESGKRRKKNSVKVFPVS